MCVTVLFLFGNLKKPVFITYWLYINKSIYVSQLVRTWPHLGWRLQPRHLLMCLAEALAGR